MPTNALTDFYSAVFFDMDGLLVDSEPLWLESETEMMAQYGYQWLESMDNHLRLRLSIGWS